MKCGIFLEKCCYSIYDIWIINFVIVEFFVRYLNYYVFIVYIFWDYWINDIIIDFFLSIMLIKEYNSYYYVEVSSGNNNNGSI